MNNFPYTTLQLSWIAAMKDGSHKWTNRTLGRISEGKVVGNCCLGVACDVFGIKPECDATAQYAVYYKQENILPEEIFRSLGLRSRTGTIVSPAGHKMSLIFVNDTSNPKLGYAPVLDILENHPEWVFTNLD